MPKMIKLHHYLSAKVIWINADAIISVVDERDTNQGTSVYTYAYAGDSIHYRVAETPETIVEMIEQTCNPLDSYTCVGVAPESINWSKAE